MDLLKRKEMIVVVCVAVTAFVGCDMLSPKPKVTKNEVKAVQVKPEVKSEVKATEEQPASVLTAVTKIDEPLPEGVLAKVGDWTLTVEEFNKRLAAVKKVVDNFNPKDLQAKQMILEELIRQQMMVQEAKEQNLQDKREIREAVRDFENSLLVQDIATRLTENIKVNEAEAKDFFDKNPTFFVKPVEKKLREVAVMSEAEAKDVLLQLLQGQDIAQLAKDRSKAKTAENGGDIGFVSMDVRDRDPKAPTEVILKAIENVTKGNFSPVFQGPENYYYVVKVEDVRGGDKFGFDDIKAALIKDMTADKQQKAIFTKLEEISKKVNVKANPALLEKTGE